MQKNSKRRLRGSPEPIPVAELPSEAGGPLIGWWHQIDSEEGMLVFPGSASAKNPAQRPDHRGYLGDSGGSAAAHGHIGQRIAPQPAPVDRGNQHHPYPRRRHRCRPDPDSGDVPHEVRPRLCGGSIRSALESRPAVSHQQRTQNGRSALHLSLGVWRSIRSARGVAQNRVQTLRPQRRQIRLLPRRNRCGVGERRRRDALHAPPERQRLRLRLRHAGVRRTSRTLRKRRRDPLQCRA